MNVNVKLFAMAKERVGKGVIEVDLPNGSTVRQLRGAIVEQFPPLADVLRHARIAVDSDYASDARTIDVRSEVAIIPPVSGG